MFYRPPIRFKRFIAIALVTAIVFFASATLGADLETIVERGKLIVAVKDNLRPLGFVNEQDQLQGLEIDLAKGLAAELLGDPEAIILQPVSNSERLQVVTDGTVDLAIASVSMTPSRSRIVDFSPFYYLDGTGIVTNNPQITGLKDLLTQKIAILEGSSAIAVIRSELPSAQLRGVESYQEAYYQLENGEIDAFAGDNSVLTGWVQEYPHYHRLSVRLSVAPLAVVMPKGLPYSSLREKVNTAIAHWQKSGWLKERATYWGLP